MAALRSVSLVGEALAYLCPGTYKVRQFYDRPGRSSGVIQSPYPIPSSATPLKNYSRTHKFPLAPSESPFISFLKFSVSSRPFA